MISHAYATHSQNQAHDLAASILSAASPPQIAAACSAVEAFLARFPGDQARPFFSVAFPALICRLFGFDGSSPSPSRPPPSSAWVDQTEPEAVARVFGLLSPRGVLMSAASAIDRHSLVKFVFPVERLPEWMRFALQCERLSSLLPSLCPLFRSRVKDDTVQGSSQIQLNVFEYYMFWFAYYPIRRGKSEYSDTMVVRKSRRFNFENWTSSWPSLSSSGSQSGQRKCGSLYTLLLYAYLQAFVPKQGFGSYQPYRSSLFHYASDYDGSVILLAEFLILTFIQFWMVDNDFSPLPVSLSSSFGLSFPFQAVLGEAPPAPGLSEVLLLLVRYLNSTFVYPSKEGLHVEYGVTSGLNSPTSYSVVKPRSSMVTSDSFVDSWNPLIQRPLYRFLLRTFLFCPIGSSMKNAGQVFSLWISYIEPWKICPEDFLEFEVPVLEKNESLENNIIQSQNRSNEGKGRSRAEQGYTSAWEGYVTSNYLFYNNLIVHFLGFAHKFLHANVETMAQMVLKVLNVLTSSRELMDHLRKIDAAYHSKYTSSSLAASDSPVHKFIPSIREQLQDWENGLCESDADGSFLHENWDHDLRLFSDNEDGAHRLLQLFILRAESEFQSHPSSNTAQKLQILDALRAQTRILFGVTRVPTARVMSKVVGTHDSPHNQGGFNPKHPGVGKSRWADVEYRGDWMRRPISNSEVAWLAKLLIKLSDRLNEVIGLHQGSSSISDGPVYIKLSPDGIITAGRPKEALRMLLALIGSWLGSIGHSSVGFMRGRGIRINLRPLASKKFVLALLVYAVVTALIKTVSRSSVPASVQP